MKLINILRTTFAALILTTSVANAGIIVTFDPSSTDVSVGDTFTVDVLATTENALTDTFLAFDIGFDFDDTLADLDSAVVSSDFLSSVSFADVAGFSTSLLGASGTDIVLATLTFTATAVGDLTLDLDSALSMFSSFSSIEFSSTAVDISVTDVSAPAAFGLLLMAGAFMFARRKA